MGHKSKDYRPVHGGYPPAHEASPLTPGYWIISPCGVRIPSEDRKYLLRIAPEWPGCAIWEVWRDGTSFIIHEQATQ